MHWAYTCQATAFNLIIRTDPLRWAKWSRLSNITPQLNHWDTTVTPQTSVVLRLPVALAGVASLSFFFSGLETIMIPLKAIFAVIGGVLIHLTLGTLYCWGKNTSLVLSIIFSD